MLSAVTIKDFAIIQEMNLDFQKGLTIITGETGSGKSLVIQALGVALGGKTSKTMVRSGAERAMVDIKVNQMDIRRIISNKGRTKSYINDEPVLEADFRKQVASIVDFHGQNDQQVILNKSSHLDYLDEYSGLLNDVKTLMELFENYQSAKGKLRAVKKHFAAVGDRKELLNFQLNEIQNINLKPDEDVQLAIEFKTLNSIDELIGTINYLAQRFLEDDTSIYNQLSESLQSLEKITRLDPQLDTSRNSLHALMVSVQDLSSELTHYRDGLDQNKSRLMEVEERLNAIEGLKRKYGGSIEAILETEKSIKTELENITTMGSDVNDLEKSIAQSEKEYIVLASMIHNIRGENITKLSKAVEHEMQKLSMPKARFQIEMNQNITGASFMVWNDKPVEISNRGIDHVEFFISPNPGERLKPLTEIASGGEISRIMLAIKTAFQQCDPVETMVFDEIDSGISGKAADKVGESLVKLAKNKQVICITHLPQIAKRADHHLEVIKNITDNKTSVSFQYLDFEHRSAAISKLIDTYPKTDPLLT